MDNLENIGRFLQRYNLPRLNQGEIENMNTPVTSSEIETVILKLLELQLWLSAFRIQQYPWGSGFNPWPHSVGFRSSISSSCSTDHRCDSDMVLIWLWPRPVVWALIWLPAWEIPYAPSTALKNDKEKIHTSKKQNPRTWWLHRQILSTIQRRVNTLPIHFRGRNNP